MAYTNENTYTRRTVGDVAKCCQQEEQQQQQEKKKNSNFLTQMQLNLNVNQKKVSLEIEMNLPAVYRDGKFVCR